jgi:hypothetical protein
LVDFVFCILFAVHSNRVARQLEFQGLVATLHICPMPYFTLWLLNLLSVALKS